MADDDVAAAGFDKHGSGNFAGEGAFLTPGNILAGDGDGGTFGGFDSGRDRCEWRSNDDVAMLGVRNEREEGGEKRAGVRERFEHFPVAGDYAASHVKASKERKDLTQRTPRTQSAQRRVAVICWLGLRRRGVCVRREIRGKRRR